VKSRKILAAVLLLVCACECSSPSSRAPEPKANTVTADSGWKVQAPDPREADLARSVAQILATRHLRSQAINDALSRKAFAEYLERLDPGKSFLLAEHVAELDKYADQMDDQVIAGDLTLARLGAAMIVARQAAVADIIAARLAAPFDFTVDETFETDNDKIKFAATDDELSDRWRKVLKLQVLERIERMDTLSESLAKALKEPDAKPEAIEEAKKALAKIPETFEGRERKARNDLAKNYAGRLSRLAKLEPLEPAETFLNALSATFDPHTLYLAPAEKENFEIEMSGSLEGIGAVLTEDDHYIRVSEIVPGGASFRQGKLEAGDLILSVAQEGEDAVDVADMRINQVVSMIRGPKGTVVTLTVKKPDDTIQTISITRDVVEIEAAYARGAVVDMGPDDEAIGFIHLPSFYGNTRDEPGQTRQRTAADDVRRLLATFEKQKIKGVVIDLRGNGGGLLDQARDITGMFIETGPVVQTRFGAEPIQVLSDDDPGVVYSGQVVVMIDRFSASASEIVAGALQDYERAVVTGTNTHGKGTVQMLLDLSRMVQSSGRLGVLKLTIQQFFRVNGASTQWRGVVPDIELPDPLEHIESGERFLDNAIPWSQVEPLRYQKRKHGWTLAQLSAASRERVVAEPLFAKVARRAEFAKKRRDETLVNLKLETWKAEREKTRKTLESMELKLDEGKPRFEAQIVSKGGTFVAKSPNQRIEQWRASLTRDPWVAETLHVIDDMLDIK
jgi:carboxyl-terminal processing protease